MRFRPGLFDHTHVFRIRLLGADLYKTGNGDVIGGWLNSLAGSLKDVMADRFDAFVRNEIEKVRRIVKAAQMRLD